jgi:hypothetical protein
VHGTKPHSDEEREHELSSYHIPRFGNAEKVFAGAPVKDLWLFAATSIGGLMIANKHMFLGFAIFIGGYVATRLYVGWKLTQTPGHLKSVLYQYGLSHYGRNFNSQKTVYTGDHRATNASLKYLKN